MQPKSTPEPGELRERALRLLARREHSRAELARKLEQAGFAGGDIALLLDDFEERNWLSDRRFAESYVADHRARAAASSSPTTLRQRGVSDSIIETVLNDNRDSELDRAREVWKKKFGSLPGNSHERARQIRFLQSRGLYADHCSPGAEKCGYSRLNKSERGIYPNEPNALRLHLSSSCHKKLRAASFSAEKRFNTSLNPALSGSPGKRSLRHATTDHSG